MILVSGDIPHALLADSSDHSFLWQPHRFRTAAALSRTPFSTRHLPPPRPHTHTYTQINVVRRTHTHTWAYQHIHFYFINTHAPRHNQTERFADTDRRVVSLVNRGPLMRRDPDAQRRPYILSGPICCGSGLTRWQWDGFRLRLCLRSVQTSCQPV